MQPQSQSHNPRIVKKAPENQRFCDPNPHLLHDLKKTCAHSRLYARNPTKQRVLRHMTATSKLPEESNHNNKTNKPEKLNAKASYFLQAYSIFFIFLSNDSKSCSTVKLIFPAANSSKPAKLAFF